MQKHLQNNGVRLNSMAGKLKVQVFRANDLSQNTGKQFELGKSWCEDFFEIDSKTTEYSISLKFKPLSDAYINLNDKEIELKLSEITGRGDRKAYANGSFGYSQIKEFFINNLKLTENNLNDYFAIYKTDLNEYYLYYVPKLLYDNFVSLFKETKPNVLVVREDKEKNELGDKTIQQIFYGAPGTGKSHCIKERTKGKKVIRTTFHPDSDYSTFVGAYKPTTIEVPMRDVTGKIIVENGKSVTENRIVYEFVEQAFLQAYIKAWKQYASAIAEGKEPEEVYLIIEEINRGNCAQIFGDLFQLLDRGDDGFSEYPIVADMDLRKQLKKAFTDIIFLNVPAVGGMSAEKVAMKIRNGEMLLFPKNLHIWATMNTSDQSLFPIDSAFKRRWDWQYVPISDGKKGWLIEANGKRYDWWQFLLKMNEKIGSTTNSEDKKLGYFFCKAKDGIIDTETFVSKVVFYIWNDVFKDFAEDAGDLFKDVDDTLLSFNKFYTVGDDGQTKVVEEKVERLLQNLGVESIAEPTTEEISEDEE